MSEPPGGLPGLSGSGMPQLPGSRTVYSGGNSGGSPFEDPSYMQNLISMVGGDPSKLPARSGNVESDGGTKRKADASLETWVIKNFQKISTPNTLDIISDFIVKEKYVV